MTEFAGLAVGGPIDGDYVASPEPRLIIAQQKRTKHPSLLSEDSDPLSETSFRERIYVLERFAFYGQIYHFWVLNGPHEQREFAFWQIQNVADTIVLMNFAYGNSDMGYLF